MSCLDVYLTAPIIGQKFIDPQQWIPLLTGPDVLNAPMETTEHQAVQPILAEYTGYRRASRKHPANLAPASARSMLKPMTV